MSKKSSKKKGAGGRDPLPKGTKKQRVVVFIEGGKIEARGGMKATQKYIVSIV